MTALIIFDGVSCDSLFSISQDCTKIIGVHVGTLIVAQKIYLKPSCFHVKILIT